MMSAPICVVWKRPIHRLLPLALTLVVCQPGQVLAVDGLPGLTLQHQLSAAVLVMAAAPLASAAVKPTAVVNMQDLSLRQALTLALERNLQFAQTLEEIEQARSFLQESRSVLGPMVSLTGSQANVTANLRAQGFPSVAGPGGKPLFATLNGPYNTFDARLRLTQAVFDANHSHLAESSQRRVQQAEHQRLAVRDQLLIATALAYITAQQSDAALAAAQANVALANELGKLARDQRSSGIATGVDVARAETRVAQEQLALTQARSDQALSLLRLKRLLGLPAGEPIRLASGLDYERRPTPGVEEAVAKAMAQRQEIQMEDARVSAAEEAVLAAGSEGLPVVALEADAGPSGITPTQTVYGTRTVGISVSVPLFTNGMLDAHRDRAKSLLRAARMAQEDTRRQVEEDVHMALLAVATSAEQVQVAQTTVTLSERLLELARDRFKSGVADNLEVFDALTALTTAQSRQIEATAAYNAARANMYAAMGDSHAFGF